MAARKRETSRANVASITRWRSPNRRYTVIRVSPGTRGDVLEGELAQRGDEELGEDGVDDPLVGLVLADRQLAGESSARSGGRGAGRSQ